MADREAAARAAVRIPIDARSLELQDAVATELLRAMKYSRERRRRGSGASADVYSGEYIGILVELAARANDRRMIPALVSAVGTGGIASNALATYGAEAIAPLVAALRRKDIPPDEIAGVLMTLKKIAAETQKLANSEKEQIRHVALRYLMGQQHAVVLGWAIELGATVGEPEVMAIIERLAVDPTEIAARGIQDPTLVEMIQKRAMRAVGQQQ
jgi:hypothetical protein